MAKYIDLSSVIDVEPEVSQVLGLIEDEDLLSEFWQRMDEDFFRVFVEDYCKDSDIRQGYVGTSSNGEARVSIRDEKAWVIIKSNGCLARLEYEIPIPKKDAEELLSFTCDRVIHKTRYIIPCEDSMLKWEVDEFHGEDEGLIIAEIELPRKDMPFEKPQWLGKEVTQDTTYYNSTLSKTSWKAIQKSRAEAKAWDDWRDSLVKK